MKASLRYTLLSILLVLSTATVSAWDWGAMITNDSKFAGKDFSNLLLDQKNAASAWLRIPFNAKGTSYFITEGMFQFEQKDIKMGDTEGKKRNANAINLNLFKFAFSWKTGRNQISISAGRFLTTDLSGLIFTQAADGALVSFDFRKVVLSAYVAYTGLLNTRTVTMIGTSVTEDDSKVYQRADDYLVEALTVSFPNLFAGQTLSLQYFGALHLKNDFDDTRIYAEASLAGPLTTTLFYNVSGTLGLLKKGDNDLKTAGLGRLTVAYYAPVKSLTIGLNGVFASKDFLGFTSQTATNALTGRTEYTELAKAGLFLTIKPVQNLLLGANGDLILNAADGIEYEGFQYGLNANWQIVSDVSVGGTFYQYFDNKDSNRNKSCIQLKAAISL